MLHGKQWFATLDLKNGYYACEVAPESRPLTAFCTPFGLYQWKRMPFGLKVAPAYFQRMMFSILGDLKPRGVVVYLDDILITGRTRQELIENTRLVLTRLKKYNLVLNGAKSEIGLQQIRFLGFEFSATGRKIARDRVEAIQEMDRPTDKKGIRRFLGICNYVRDFLPNLAELTAPLHELTRKGCEFEWTMVHEQSFRKLKEAIANKTVLAHYDRKAELYLATDASDIGLGAVLQQQVDTQPKEILLFISKKFTDVEKRWSTVEQEAFAVYYAIRKLEHYLLGRPFVVQTDHRNLLYLHRAPSAKVMRWKMYLTQFDFTIMHIPGRDNVIPDALSRNFDTTEVECVAQVEEVHLEGFEQLLFAAQGKVGELESSEDGWFLLSPEKKDETLELIKWLHERNDCHDGVRQLLQTLKEKKVKGKRLNEMVREVVRKCPICAKQREQVEVQIAGTLASFKPLEAISMDTMGPFESTEEGYRDLLVMIDDFTRFVVLAPLKTVSAKETMEAFIAKWMAYFGAPAQVRTDGGRQFDNSLFKEFFAKLKVTHLVSSPHHHEGNGIVERMNREVLKQLRLNHLTSPDCSWFVGVPIIMETLNRRIHSVLKESPKQILFGPRETIPMEEVEIDSQALTLEDFKMLAEEYNLTVQLIREAAVEEQELVEFEKDQRPREILDVGTKVWKVPLKRTKLEPRLLGPFKVVEKVSEFQYGVETLDGRDRQDVHVSRLRRCDVTGTEDELLALQATDTEDYVVEAILGHGINDSNELVFQVKWFQYPDAENTWETIQTIYRTEAIMKYLRDTPEAVRLLESRLSPQEREVFGLNDL
ncbi:Transposon Tf2-8 polyprotein [Aduncisulcus paluster]|uniref:Transposon Tf2-8 polyprotein n=1 Tax=Aduncisulcus paluster TaxID=2918883 RepID=A0ABQ5KUK6_9EUKA|nr:Transposon Tf2-8 polyprotein [Aduncisulcus paluster]